MKPFARSMLAGSIATLLALASNPAIAATTTLRWGPITIPAADAMGPGMVKNEIAGLSGLAELLAGLFTSVANFSVNKPCSDCYITQFKPNLVFADGSLANMSTGVMLHHVVNMNVKKPDVTCPPGFSGMINQLGLVAGGNQRFFASGNERTILTLASGYGYRVSSSDQWALIYDLENSNPTPVTVYFEYTFTWVSSGKTATRPLWFDIDQCEDSELNTPAGYSDIQWSWNIDRSGTIVTIGGHVHDHGISTGLYNVSKNANVFTSIAGYEAGSMHRPAGPGSGADVAHPANVNTVTSDPLGLMTYEGHLADMTTGNPAKTVSKGNTLRLHTQYNRPDPGEGDMGIMIGFMKENLCITDLLCF